ncbi:hypothetical protein AA309_06095 [Microvirga vignae]|uniref:Uncharacterized protein n=1 Tax=Microvirga vignae TaxID=1225564 RepID=A0A0H1RGR2_9HYPH|nr:hypothetical protein [Microvirga vignae]KLK94026.1 hypothetical protein AA309_06095 [Microvirga vignae]
MPSIPSAPAFPKGDSDLRIIRVLGQRPALAEGAEMGPPPAATERAETVFETMGLILVLLIVLAAVWILIRKRL